MILSGNSNLLKPNCPNGITIREHHIYVMLLKQDDPKFQLWGWHGWAHPDVWPTKWLLQAQIYIWVLLWEVNWWYLWCYWDTIGGNGGNGWWSKYWPKHEWWFSQVFLHIHFLGVYHYFFCSLNQYKCSLEFWCIWVPLPCSYHCVSRDLNQYTKVVVDFSKLLKLFEL